MKMLLGLMAAPLLVAGCSAPSAQPTVTATVTERAIAPQPQPETGATGDDATYLSLLASEGVVSDAKTSIEVGKGICDALDNGYEGSTIIAVAESSGFTRNQGIAIVAAAVVVYCPWNEGQALL